eukprot:TRINITY_DN4025_c0_g7_i1.p1 TRINITY_DN4025_c0_g7~~TRINITY_DN4025_c0_g7_i1.p1  ORF type:complete len:602 (-),score=109.77 TRINITY_DN4025_c0_g7_i1:20-1825(-)
MISILSLLELNETKGISKQLLRQLDTHALERNLLEIINDIDNGTCDENQIELGYLFYFLLLNLKKYDKDLIKPILDKVQSSAFVNGTGTIEIIRDNILERVYFRIPDICYLLPENSKVNIETSVKRDTHQDKITDFFNKSALISEEIKLRERISQKSSISLLVSKYELIRDFAFVVSLLINFLVIWGYESSSNKEFTLSRYTYISILFLGMIEIALSCISLITYCISYVPLIYTREKDKLDINTLKGKIQFVRTLVEEDLSVLYLFCLVICSLLGTIFSPKSPYYFTFHLFEIIYRFDLLKKVIKSVTQNGKSILLTAILAFVVIYVYSIFGFLFFRNKFLTDDGNICDSLAECLLSFIYYGLRSGGGIGDVMNPPLWEEPGFTMRTIFDSTFFFLVIIILLNIIFGIIIDTFGELRSKNDELINEIQNKCFICGIDRDTFDEHENEFDDHVQNVHNFMHYIYFRTYLEKKDYTEYTGTEQYIVNMIENKDWSFILGLKTLYHKEEESEQEELSNLIIALNMESERINELSGSLQTQKYEILESVDDISQKYQQMEDRIGSIERKLDMVTQMLSYIPIESLDNPGVQYKGKDKKKRMRRVK